MPAGEAGQVPVIPSAVTPAAVVSALAPARTSALREMLKAPAGRELEVGVALLAISPDDLRSLGCGSLSELIQRKLLRGLKRPEYSTVMRWVRAAEMLGGPDDPLCDWGVSRLVELGRITDVESRRDFATAYPSAASASVRELRRLIDAHLTVEAVRGVSSKPDAILQRAVSRALERLHPGTGHVAVKLRHGHHGDPRPRLEIVTAVAEHFTPEAVATATGVAADISVARRVWQGGQQPSNVPPSQPMELAEILSLPPGQLEALWATPDLVELRKAGVTIRHLAVRRLPAVAHEIIKPAGNTKTGTWCGVLNTISQGCLRTATGLAGTDTACYVAPDNACGCFANESKVAGRSRHIGFDVARNGLVNDALLIRLPKSGSRSLTRYDQDLWRVDSESADGCLSVALGLLQGWAEANPQAWFFTICSHAARPSDGMLAWLAILRNAWCGHTVSAAFSPEDLDVRFDAARRFLDWGIPGIIWIATRVGWDNAAVLRRARHLVPDELIIETPYRRPPSIQELPLLGVNPLGACSDHRSASRGLQYDLGGPDTEMPRKMPLSAHARCRGCRLRCGLQPLLASGRLSS